MAMAVSSSWVCWAVAADMCMCVCGWVYAVGRSGWSLRVVGSAAVRWIRTDAAETQVRGRRGGGGRVGTPQPGGGQPVIRRRRRRPRARAQGSPRPPSVVVLLLLIFFFFDRSDDRQANVDSLGRRVGFEGGPGSAGRLGPRPDERSPAGGWGGERTGFACCPSQIQSWSLVCVFARVRSRGKMSIGRGQEEA